MKMRLTGGRTGEVGRIDAGYLAAVGGASVILSLAGGFAFGIGAITERLTVNAAASEVMSGARPSLPALRIADRRGDAPKVATSASFAHVVDRWFDEPAVATAPGER